jgi:hypothetical protein
MPRSASRRRPAAGACRRRLQHAPTSAGRRPRRECRLKPFREAGCPYRSSGCRSDPARSDCESLRSHWTGLIYPFVSEPLGGTPSRRRSSRTFDGRGVSGSSTFPVRIAHSVVGGSAWEPTPWGAVQRAAWETLRTDMTRLPRAFPLVAVLLVMSAAAEFPPSVITNQDRSSGWPLNSMAPSVRSRALSRGPT